MSARLPAHTPRIAIGGFSLESNSQAPLATRQEFEANVLLIDDQLAGDLRAPHPRSPRCVAGFVSAMDGSGLWTAVPTVLAAVGASGSCDQIFFDWLLEQLLTRLKAAAPLDGVYLALHGAADASADADPDGTLLRCVRQQVGPDVPIVVTLDLHANVSAQMVQHADVMVAYRTNPHVDMWERGADCAQHLRAMLAGLKTTAAFRKLPLAPPTVTMSSAPGTPYGDILAFGQQQVRDGVLDVSVSSGFTNGDTPKNGMSVVVTATTSEVAETTARAVACYAWSQRARFVTQLHSLEQATALAVAAGRAETSPVLCADVADNPGGGGRGNTTWILAAFHAANVQACVIGPFFDPLLAAEAHALGIGASFKVRCNRDEPHPLSAPWSASGKVLALCDGRVIGRRGIFKNRQLSLGPSALIEVGGVRLVVGSIRQQAADAGYFEMLGVDLAKVRVLVVKSRGHFRAAFDEYFSNERIVEVDVPGLTTPVLTRVPWRRMPRPMYPLDAATSYVAD